MEVNQPLILVDRQVSNWYNNQQLEIVMAYYRNFAKFRLMVT